MHHTAFIKSNTKKYNFIKEDKSILHSIKYKTEGKGVWWNIDLKSALYFIITTSQTWATTQTTPEQHRTIFNLHENGGPHCIISKILVNKFHTDKLKTNYLIKIAKQVYNDYTA